MGNESSNGSGPTSIDGKDLPSNVPIPPDEKQRLQELYEWELLDTPPEEPVDRLTQIAKINFDAAVSALTLIDADRQWIKSTAGTDRYQCPREDSFCTYAILSEELMVVPDTRKDERFGPDYAVVDGREIRSYMGAPLTTDTGHNLGTLCVFDFEAKSFPEHKRELLKVLRDQAMDWIQSRQHDRSLEELAHYDSVTNFPKRHRFQTLFEQQLEQRAEEDKPLAVCHLDLTRFRRVNETLGYEAAEQILGTVARRIREVLGESTLKTRVFGDEFLVVLPEVASKDHAHRQIQSLIQRLRDPISTGDETFMFSARAGLSLYPETGRDVNALLRQASAALKEASPEAGSPIQMYIHEMDLPSSGAVNIERDFHHALKQDEFQLHYQPIFNSVNRSLAGVEALIRWEHPTHGMIPPPTIISVAETLGTMADLGRWVMKTACGQVQRWNRRRDLDLELGVNVSAIEFQQGESFVESVRDVLETTGFSAKNLRLEVTETEAMHDIALIMELLVHLRSFGVSLAIDDFGTGQSSLEYLAEFPEATLKIDRSFVDGILTNRRKRIIIENTVNMANQMELDTVAEGVEEEGQEEFLREIGCPFYQGYYFSKPKSAASFEEDFLA